MSSIVFRSLCQIRNRSVELSRCNANALQQRITQNTTHNWKAQRNYKNFGHAREVEPRATTSFNLFILVGLCVCLFNYKDYGMCDFYGEEDKKKEDDAE